MDIPTGLWLSQIRFFARTVQKCIYEFWRKEKNGTWQDQSSRMSDINHLIHGTVLVESSMNKRASDWQNNVSQICQKPIQIVSISQRFLNTQRLTVQNCPKYASASCFMDSCAVRRQEAPAAVASAPCSALPHHSDRTRVALAPLTAIIQWAVCHNIIYIETSPFNLCMSQFAALVLEYPFQFTLLARAVQLYREMTV